MLGCSHREVMGSRKFKMWLLLSLWSSRCHAEVSQKEGVQQGTCTIHGGSVSEEPRPTKDCCHKPRCDQTASLSSTTAVFSLAWIPEIKQFLSMGQSRPGIIGYAWNAAFSSLLKSCFRWQICQLLELYALSTAVVCRKDLLSWQKNYLFSLAKTTG